MIPIRSYLRRHDTPNCPNQRLYPASPVVRSHPDTISMASFASCPAWNAIPGRGFFILPTRGHRFPRGCQKSMTPALFVEFGFEALLRSRLGIIVARIALWTRHSCAAAGALALERSIRVGFTDPATNPHKRSTSWGLLPCRAFLSRASPAAQALRSDVVRSAAARGGTLLGQRTTA